MNTIMRITIKRPWFGDSVTLEFAGSGSADSLRGRTNSLLIIDEAEFMKEEVYLDILLPSTAKVDGFVLLTSTVKDAEGWFWNNHLTFQEMRKEGFTEMDSMLLDVHDAGVKSEAWIRSQAAYHKRIGKSDTWNREYLCIPGSSKELAASPFKAHVNEVMRVFNKKPTKPIDFSMLPTPTVFTVCDIGGVGNSPYISFVPDGSGKYLILHAKDDYNGHYEPLDALVEMFPRMRHVVIYPNDVNQPAVMDGPSRFTLLRDYIKSRGYKNIMSLYDLPKTKNRAELIESAVDILGLCIFSVHNTKDFLNHLARVRFKIDKASGYIDKKKFVTNGSQHSGDALGYLAVAINMGYMAHAHRGVSDGIEGPMTYNSGYRGNLSYNYLKRR